MKPFIMSKEKNQRLIRWLHNYKIRLMLILFLYLNIVGFTPESSDSTGTSNTFVDFMFGLGKYADVSFNCKGQVTSVTKHSYVDYGAGFTHKIDVINLGIRGGQLIIKDAVHEATNISIFQNDYEVPGYSTFYINPFVGLNTKYFELNGGVLWFSNTSIYDFGNLDEYLFLRDLQITGDIRIGNREAFHFTSQYLSSIPLLTGSIFDMGFGFGNKESRTITWVGLSFGPFQNLGLSLKQKIQVTNNFDLLLKGRIGQVSSNLEGSISAGARYNF